MLDLPLTKLFPQGLKNYLFPVALCIYTIFLIATAVYFVPPTWDEYLDFSGCVGAANHLFAFFRGHTTDITTITHDLEWYGNSYRWPAYILWAISSGLPVKIPEGTSSYEYFLNSPFSTSIHIWAAIYGAIGLYAFASIVRLLRIGMLLRLTAVATFAFSPIWLANSFWNLKDLPVATVSLLLLLILLQSTLNNSFSTNRQLLVAALLGTILANKYAYFPLVSIYVAISSFVGYFAGSYKDLTFRRALRTFLSFSFIRLTLVLLFASYVVSLLLTPQNLAHPYFPINATSYFATHPLVQRDHIQSLSFIISRSSFLLTPPLAILIVLAGISPLLAFRKRFFGSRPNTSQLKIARLLVHIFAWVPFLFYVLTIFITGRSFYGPDLRHLIWLYPPLIISFVLSCENLLRSLPGFLRNGLSVLLVCSIPLTLIEMASIYPHYYSYAGLFPSFLPNDGKPSRLYVSSYLPNFAPELQAGMFFQCSLNPRCLIPSKGALTSDPISISGLSFPMNPAYRDAYLRLGARARRLLSHDLLQYKLDIIPAGECQSLTYTKTRGKHLYAKAVVCDKI